MQIPHVLCVDHDFEAKRKTAIMLFSNGIECFPVSSLRDAIAILRVLAFDLVICNAHLSDGDVDHLIQTMKSSRTLQKVPLLVLGGDQAEAREKYHRLGAAGFLDKGCEPGQSLKTIQELIKGQLGNVRKQTSKGILGQLARTNIIDLIIELAESHGSGTIVLDSSQQMEIHLRDGRIVDARHGITVGKKALFRCLAVAEAAFHFQPGNEPMELQIQGELNELLDEARMSNEKLMANFHLFPNLQHRIRILNSDRLLKINLRPEVRAAIEIIRKYPRVGSFLDRFNLPDVVCYEYLLALLERELVELVTEQKPVQIITDGSCDLPKALLQELGVQVLPIQLQVGNESFMGLAGEEHLLYSKKPKQLEGAKLIAPGESIVLKSYLSWVRSNNCLSLLGSSNLMPIMERVQSCNDQLMSQGIDGKSLLANELVVLDSHTLSVGLGLLVREAARMAKEGARSEQIEERLLAYMARLFITFVVWPEDSLLVRKGSTPVVLAWDGESFQVVHRFERGESPVPYLVELVRKRFDFKSQLHVAVGHIRNPAIAESLCNSLQQSLGIARPPLSEIGPASGHLLGDNAIALAFFS